MIRMRLAGWRPKEEQTPLQQQKMRFVLQLCDRPTRAPDTLTTRDGESRLAAVNRAMAEGEEANRGNPWMASTKRRDKLRKQLGFWWAIGADKGVLSWIGFGVRLQFESEPPRWQFGNHRSYYEHIEHVRKEHVQHLEDGSYRVAEASEVRLGNPLQVEVNAKGKLRTCEDARAANAYIADYDFTQETISAHVAKAIVRDMEMITTDIEKAYYQVPLHKESQAYLAWRHDGQWIVPTIIVFGVKPAPFVFTKICRPILRFVRALGIRGSNCIDDNIWIDRAGEPMREVITIVQLVFGKLGWTFNCKCVFAPSTVALYNGMWLDSKRYEIRATAEKIDAARRLVWALWYRARDGEAVEVKQLQRLTGRLQSMSAALEGVAVWTRGLYADIARAQERYQQRIPPRATTHLRDAAMTDLWFWARRLSNPAFNGRPLVENREAVQITMYTDASDIGWGAHSQDDGGWKDAGTLGAEWTGKSSTAREVRGLMEAAKRREGLLRGKHVCIQMDSYPAIRNLINGGGPVEELNEMVREWWSWCKARGIYPSYKWIPREENAEADKLSKEAAQVLALTTEAERKVRRWLEDQGQPGEHLSEWLRTRVQAPALDRVQERIEEMIRSRRPACIVVPKWQGRLWWALLREHSIAHVALGPAAEVLRLPQAHQWVFEAHLLSPETLRRQKA